MKRVIFLCAMMLLWNMQVFAFGHTTILGERLTSGNRTGVIPVVDGVKSPSLQKNINNILRSAAMDLAGKAGGKVNLSYEVTLNRPSLFSLVIKAVGNKTLYKGINIDDTTGKEIVPKDLFYENATYNQLIGGKNYVYGEKGLLLSTLAAGPYTQLVPYSQLIKAVNVAEGARFIPSYKLTETAENKVLRLKTGELVALYLRANPTTGYNWIIANGDKLPGFVPMGNSFYLPSETNGVTGSPGTTIIFFSFDKPGSYSLALNYDRTWENKPIYTKTFHFVAE